MIAPSGLVDILDLRGSFHPKSRGCSTLSLSSRPSGSGQPALASLPASPGLPPQAGLPQPEAEGSDFHARATPHPRNLAQWLRLALAVIVVCAGLPAAMGQSCGAKGVALQVLGSGGPELQDKRASSSYLVWEDGRAKAVVDAGGGSAVRFGESGAQMSQLDLVLFTHFHVDHSGDFAALIKSSWFEDRKRDLPIYGPPGNDFMPSTTELVSDFFGDRGAYRYLSELLVQGEEGSYKMQPHDVIAGATPVDVFSGGDLSVQAVRVIHGGVPALAWRVQEHGKVMVFSGDTNGEGAGLVRLAKDADVFVAHNAVPEGATGVERRLHMPPSVIGQIAGEARVKSLVLSHRMLRTLGKEEETQAEIRKRYAGPIAFANDLDCFAVK